MDIELYTRVVVYVLTGLVGLCVGSFLNVVIYRVPNGMSIAFPPSHCTVCDYTLKWYDNVPVFSYLFLGGKCRKCKTHISFRYTLVEIGNAALWLLCVWRCGFSDWRSAVCAGTCAVACSVCLCVACIDIEHMIILDRFQIMLAVLAVLYTAVGTPVSSWLSHALSGLAAGGLFLLIGYIVSKVKGREALGGGDVKLAFVTGLFLGWERLLLMMLLASLSASVILLILERKNKNSDTEYPFGPFLTAGFVAALIFGDIIINTYLRVLGME